MTLAQTQVFDETPPLAGSVWNRLRLDAASAAAEEPMLASFLNAAILRHDGLTEAFAHRYASQSSTWFGDERELYRCALSQPSYTNIRRTLKPSMR